MSNQSVLNIISEIMEVDSVGLDLELDEENWDSLAVISFIAEVDSKLGQLLDAKSVNESKTVAELVSLVSNDC